MRLCHCLVPALLLCLASPIAARNVDVSASVSGVSDYRFRGISLSDEDPALQASLGVDHESGFYAAAWGSTLDDTPLYGAVELDLYGGWRREVASGTTLDVGLLYYLYPDGEDLAGPSDFAEPYASITHNFGPVTGKIGAAYAWEQAATGGGNNLFVYTDWTTMLPGTPVTLKAHLGHSDGTLSPTGDYFEWLIGADFAVGPAVIGLAYVDSDLEPGPNVDAAIVASLNFSF